MLFKQYNMKMVMNDDIIDRGKYKILVNINW